MTMQSGRFFSFRKWLYKPKRDDPTLLARFYHADEDLNAIANELDSFDGRKQPRRCVALVQQLRACQDRVLQVVAEMIDECVPADRHASRQFRVKFPDDVLQDSLAGQLWFGAECLAAGSFILHREEESENMRGLARTLCSHLDSLRVLLKDQALRNPAIYTHEIEESLVYFDQLFAEFEFSYVGAMVPIKSKKEYYLTQDMIVLFSETADWCLKKHLLTQDMIDDYEPSVMFTIPRQAIVCGLLVFPDGPINPNGQPEDLPPMLRPFKDLLTKIKELLATLNAEECLSLQKTLCSEDPPEEPSLEDAASDVTAIEHSSDTITPEVALPKVKIELPLLTASDEDSADDHDDEEQDDHREMGNVIEEAMEGNRVAVEGSRVAHSREESAMYQPSQDSGCASDIGSPVVPRNHKSTFVDYDRPAVVGNEVSQKDSIEAADSKAIKLLDRNSSYDCRCMKIVAPDAQSCESSVVKTFESSNTTTKHSNIPELLSNPLQRGSNVLREELGGRLNENATVSTQTDLSLVRPACNAQQLTLSQNQSYSDADFIKTDSLQVDHAGSTHHFEAVIHEFSKGLAESIVNQAVYDASSTFEPSDSDSLGCSFDSIEDSNDLASDRIHDNVPSSELCPSVQSDDVHSPHSDALNTELTKDSVDEDISHHNAVSVKEKCSCNDPEKAIQDDCSVVATEHNRSSPSGSSDNTSSALNGSENISSLKKSSSSEQLFADGTRNILSHDANYVKDQSQVSDNGTEVVDDSRIPVSCFGEVFDSDSSSSESLSSQVSTLLSSSLDSDDSRPVHSAMSLARPNNPVPVTPEPEASETTPTNSSQGGLMEFRRPTSRRLNRQRARSATASVLPVSSSDESEVEDVFAFESVRQDLESARRVAEHARVYSRSASEPGQPHPRAPRSRPVRADRPSSTFFSRSVSLEAPPHRDVNTSLSSSSEYCTSPLNIEHLLTYTDSHGNVRNRWRNRSDLMHRLFVCISGVADQLQTNWAADMRHILQHVLEMHKSPYDEQALSAQEDGSADSTHSSNNDSPRSPSHDIPTQMTREDVQSVTASSDSSEGAVASAPTQPTQHSVTPIDPPPWLPDAITDRCMSCTSLFTVLRRRHHCRNCGKIFCGRCSSNWAPLPHYGITHPVRVCQSCYVCDVTPFVDHSHI